MKTRYAGTIVALVALAALAGGCYKRTVATSGIGSYGTNVQDGYRSNTAADRWYDGLFSTPKPKKKTRWVETAK